LAPVWSALRNARRSALIPYLTAGFPTPDASLQALRAADRVSDILEVGVPFSDPLADGPTIQRSTFEALRQGMTLAGTLELIARAKLSRPVVVFSYLNPILRYGVERFLSAADALGVAGLLLTDRPAGSDPPVERAIEAGAQGFVYLVARLGVTGATASLEAGLEASIARVRAATAVPVAVGFGISTPAQAATVSRLADGVVVGSALVDILGTRGVDAAAGFLASLRAALDGGDGRS
jgi:tryptophan synthase alpha chain